MQTQQLFANVWTYSKRAQISFKAMSMLQAYKHYVNFEES